MSLFGQDRSFLDALSSQDRTALLASGSPHAYAPNETVLREGENSTFVLVILSGWSVVSVETERGARLILALRGAGEVIGDLAAVDQRPRSATVTALGALDGVVVPGPQFRGFLASRPAATSLIMRQLSSRLRSADVERRSLASGTVLQRLAARLLELVERTGSRDPEGVAVNLPLPQHELAAAVSATREAVAKALRLLREEDVVRTGHRRLVVTNMPLLRLLAGGQAQPQRRRAQEKSPGGQEKSPGAQENSPESPPGV
ncbi:Crp/Fnr family transcriptional regulator [Streptomyces sp. ODS28]|uniref:Crp/Fnr family transcriptional regulator n=1 Tax=Streptomyces sp. ODS28 TaxID=3136688 RepID=UPI0031EDFB9D